MGTDVQSPDKHAFFNVIESDKKISVYSSAILLIVTDKIDCRNQVAYIKGETREYTLTHITLKYLLLFSPELVQVAKSILVSTEVIHFYRYDIILLKNLFTGWDNKEITLHRSYRKEFYRRMENKY